MAMKTASGWFTEACDGDDEYGEQQYDRVRVLIGEVELNCMVASSPELQTRGLQGHKELGNNEGMVFPYYEEPRSVSFHMASVSFPIDMIFVGGDSRVNKIVRNVEPGTRGTFSMSHVAMVVEVNGGFCDEHEIEVGTEVRQFVDKKAQIDPKFYVFKASGGLWISPFHENVSVNTHLHQGPFTSDEVLRRISGVDISLIIDKTGGNVKWINGSNITKQMLDSMEESPIRVPSKAPSACECGALKSKTPHASWCPRFDPDNKMKIGQAQISNKIPWLVNPPQTVHIGMTVFNLDGISQLGIRYSDGNIFELEISPEPDLVSGGYTEGACVTVRNVGCVEVESENFDTTNYSSLEAFIDSVLLHSFAELASTEDYSEMMSSEIQVANNFTSLPDIDTGITHDPDPAFCAAYTDLAVALGVQTPAWMHILLQQPSQYTQDVEKQPADIVEQVEAPHPEPEPVKLSPCEFCGRKRSDPDDVLCQRCRYERNEITRHLLSAFDGMTKSAGVAGFTPALYDTKDKIAIRAPYGHTEAIMRFEDEIGEEAFERFIDGFADADGKFYTRSQMLDLHDIVQSEELMQRQEEELGQKHLSFLRLVHKIGQEVFPSSPRPDINRKMVPQNPTLDRYKDRGTPDTVLDNQPMTEHFDQSLGYDQGKTEDELGELDPVRPL